MADNRWWKLIRQKMDKQPTKTPKLPVVMAGTTAPIVGKPHKSDALADKNPNGRTGNNHRTPTPQRYQEGGDRMRYQDIANSHLSEGPTPGRIPRPFKDLNVGKDGRGMSGQREGNIGLVLGITGVRSGGLGDAMFIPHTSILRPAGRAAGTRRTIDDGAQIPGVYLADPTRR